MAASWPTATIMRGDTRMDAAVPPGTTIAGLLSMSKVDVSDADVRITRSDGQPADLAAVIGEGVPSGVLISVTNATATSAAQRAAQRVPSRWLVEGPAQAGALLFATALAVAGMLPLFVANPETPWWGRMAMGAGAIVVAASLIRGPFSHTPTMALALPALFGAGAAALVPAGIPLPSQIGLAAAVLGAALTAFVWNLVARSPARLASAAAWASVACILVAGALLELSVSEIAALTLLAAVILVRVAPSKSLPIPQTQLLDLPLLATSTSVRALPADSPSRITVRRVERTVAWAGGVTRTLLTAASIIAVLSAAAIVPTFSLAGVQGWGTLVLLACAIAALGLTPRAYDCAIARWLPRLAAVAMVGIGGWRLAGAMPSLVPLLVLLLAGLILFLGIALTREPRSAFAGYLADFVQGVALVALIPAAFAASGLFDLVREVLS